MSESLKHIFPYEPTPCQQTLLEALEEFVYGRDSKTDIMVVNGYAGTGKTTVMATLVKDLNSRKRRFRLMAPTGRAAKVLSAYTGHSALTIHKSIYRQKSTDDWRGEFSINENKDTGTIYIVDEASLISVEGGGAFGSGNLLFDLISYVRQGPRNKLILVGDNAQLPPIGMEESPALSPNFLWQYGECRYVTLSSVVRQAADSGILTNATVIRRAIEAEQVDDWPKMDDSFPDFRRITGGELLEALQTSFDLYGADETVVLTRSNKRAIRYNFGIRKTILGIEEELCRGDKLMVVKNCYQFVDDLDQIPFIANGDIVELVKIHRYDERYGLHFADATLSFPFYDDVEIEAKIILDTLNSESPSLTEEQQKTLYEGVMADYSHIRGYRMRQKAVREDLYYNALQIKHAEAITCHKAQGGQWSSVFVDNAFWYDEITTEDLKWLYTALTRATKQIYLVNFNKQFFN
ncbi:MAG: AAA family ATPase [Bacteroidales bacterium]|nr:AAA family ATPase [Bacteroidales bacterium]